MATVYQSKLTVALNVADAIGDHFLENGAYSVSIEPIAGDETNINLVVMADSKKWFKSAGIAAPISPVKASEWKHTYHSGMDTIPLIDGVAIHSTLSPSESDDAKKNDADQNLVIRLDPRDAFGDGNHPTTRICAGFIRSVHQETPVTRFLDVGTGTGILAILACKLGILEVDAFDMDPQSVRKAQKNARINGCKIRIKAENVMMFTPIGTYDLVVANLQTVLILESIDRLMSWTRSNGTLILSGVSTQWRAEVMERMQEMGCLVTTVAESDWCGFKVKKATSGLSPF